MLDRSDCKDATLTLRVKPDLLRRIDKIAAAEFEPRSEAARRALEAGLKGLESSANQ
jgi:predicted transcriptional regulator